MQVLNQRLKKLKIIDSVFTENISLTVTTQILHVRNKRRTRVGETFYPCKANALDV